MLLILSRNSTKQAKLIYDICVQRKGVMQCSGSFGISDLYIAKLSWYMNKSAT